MAAWFCLFFFCLSVLFFVIFGAASRAGGDEAPAPEFLEHVVLPDDTLVGICLKYKVRDGNKCEGMEVFSGDQCSCR